MVNGHIEQNHGDKQNGTDSPVHHKITKHKNQSKSVPWDDDSVVMVNVVSKDFSYSLPSGQVGQFKSSTLPAQSQSACSSPLKTCLSAGEPASVNGSPSPSPKMKKKSIHPTASLPQKPGAIDNSSLITVNSSKVWHT